MSGRVALAVNPSAGAGRGARTGLRAVHLLRSAGLQVQVLLGDGAADLAARAAAAVAAGTDALVVIGGDGMAHLGVNAVAGSEVPLGILPAGTGNDIARGLGLVIGRPEAAVRSMLDALAAGPRRVDAVRCSARQASGWFAGVLAAGFDTVVNERANGWAWPTGRAKYLLALGRELPVLHPREYVLELDGRTCTTAALLVAVANAPSYGGGMRVCPNARMDDGWLDVLLVPPMSRAQFVRVFPRVYTGTHLQHPGVRVLRARQVTIAAEKIIGYADGERFGALPIRCEVVPGVLAVLAPGTPATGR